tara:strand:+ start:2769 stop:3299 length:531 start_codon:yes stop_codon:yes gene_type:complete
MNYLGLDISTSVVGVTLLDDNGELIFCEAWDLRPLEKDLLVKADVVKQNLQNIKLPVDYIMIEQPLERFIQGRSSIKTILMLAKFNCLISYICKEMWGVVPEYLAATSARKKCGIVAPRGENVKEFVLKYLLDTEPNFNIEYTRHGNPKHGSFDRADSFVVARAGFELCKLKSSES